MLMGKERNRLLDSLTEIIEREKAEVKKHKKGRQRGAPGFGGGERVKRKRERNCYSPTERKTA